MNHTTSRMNKPRVLMSELIKPWAKGKKINPEQAVQIPAYLEETYWWAYVRPYALAFFDRQWIANLILLGNMLKLQEMAFDELGSPIYGNTLQIASVYGDFSVNLAQRIADNGSLDIIDVVPAQLENLKRKFLPTAVRFIQSDSTNLNFTNETYDQAIMFFLLHEMPTEVREKTLSEALRVIKPGGKLVIVDFHKPTRFNPFRYLYPLMFTLLEPFALDIWRDKITDWLPKDFVPSKITEQTAFGGLYQKVVIWK